MQIYDIPKKLTINRDVIQSPDLTDRFTSDELSCIGDHVFNGYKKDDASRYQWKRRNEAAMDLAMQVQRDKTFPWPGCSNVLFPLVTIAALQFSSRSYSNIIQGTNVVKYRVAGDDPTGELTLRAKRIGAHMSWQVLEQDKAWEEQHDRLLINLGIVGCNFIKSYFSPTRGHNANELVMARDLVLDYFAKSVESCARKTHVIPLYRNEIYERVRSDIFRDVLEEAWFTSVPSTTSGPETAQHDNRLGITPAQPDEDTPFRTLEQHRLLDLDHDGYSEPYIVTIEETSRKVLRITSRIEREEDVERTLSGKIRRIKAEEFFTKFGFIPAPDGGIYDVGFGTLIGPLNEAVNSGINQILDNGTMMNSNGGFLGRGAKIRGGVYTFAPWEWKRVDSTGDDLRKSLVQLPVREPSNVMFQMLSLLINYTDRMAGTVDTMVGENPGQNTKTGVANQTLEQGMQVYSSIFKRVWRSFKEEFSKNHQLNRQYLPERERFGDNGQVILQEDYKTDSEQIAPVADPRLLSDTQRLQQAQAMREASQQVPGYDIVEVERNFLQALRIDSIDRVYPGPDKVPALPNPKAQVEELKMKSKQMDFDHQKWLFVQQLQEDRRVNNAKIAQLEAQALKLMADAKASGASLQLDALKATIEALQVFNESLTARIQATKEADSNEAGPIEGGVPGLAAPPSNEGVPSIPG